MVLIQAYFLLPVSESRWSELWRQCFSSLLRLKYMPSFSKNPTQTDIKRTLKYFWKKNQPSVHTICYAVTRWQALEKPKGISHNLSNNHITENSCLIFEHFCSPPTPFQKSPVIFKQQVNRLLYKTPSFSGC